MNDPTLEMVKLLLQAVIAVGALGAAIMGYMAKKAIQEVHLSLNSRLTELLDQTAASSRAEGRDSMRPKDDMRTEEGA